MNQSFQIKTLSLTFQLALVALTLATFPWITKKEFSSLYLLWLFIGLTSLLEYILYKKHKYIQINESQIQIFHSVWKGKQRIERRRIKALDSTSRKYCIHLLDGKKVKIRKSLIHEDDHFKLELALKSFMSEA
ncbi:hypothetical protein [Lishizhenia sp.]|uniref:hypothetical protein n=1 Tax=Lishizhenia sp. TaxID=2497594 RepID=UPI00299E8A60|nr:hypothetical protein [Lishizhenia sp.]MDX1447354.1 hypothetical protein [Lishizhenia sp.]